MKITPAIYRSDYQAEWDSLIDTSVYSLFIHKRGFIEYHGERFSDLSLMFFQGNKLAAVIPGHRESNLFFSHNGLTFGGLIGRMSNSFLINEKVFQAFVEELKKQGINRVVYKAVPLVYHKRPSQEDLWFISRLKGSRISCSVSTVVDRKAVSKLSSLRTRGKNKALKCGIVIEHSNNVRVFWDILETNLKKKFHAVPVHSYDEIQLLVNLFPENIRLYVASIDNSPVAGVLFFLGPKIAKAQYIIANPVGREKGALDLLFYRVLNDFLNEYDLFDLGTSMDSNNTSEDVNRSLIFQKEGFGGRTVIYETYSFSIP